MHFINWCTWKSSQYYIIISMTTSFMRMSQKLVFHESKCICAIKLILSTTAMYVSSSFFMCLRIPCYWDAFLNSSALHVGVTTSLNTILLTRPMVLKLSWTWASFKRLWRIVALGLCNIKAKLPNEVSARGLQRTALWPPSVAEGPVWETLRQLRHKNRKNVIL